MDSSNMHSLKRKASGKDLPSPETILHLLEGSNKRQKLSNVPRSLEDSKAASVLHSLPSNIIPIIQPPLKPNDFFSDLTDDISNPNVAQQIDGILRKFPPPIPPYLPNDVRPAAGGIMIPFIYPPPPKIDLGFAPRNDGINKPIEIANNSMSSTTSATIPTNYAPHRDVSSPLEDKVYAQIPPLPFPPPNYMPYPLISDESSLTPSEVFSSFLKASENLPRIDMVVASAAGSLFEMKSQANEEGFTIQDFENEKRRQDNKFERDREDTSDLDFSSERDLEDYYEYARNIDTTDAFDYYNISSKNNDYSIGNRDIFERYLNVSKRESNIKSSSEEIIDYSSKIKENELSSVPCPPSKQEMLFIDTYDLLRDKPKEIILANGNNREKRRECLMESLNELSSYEERKRYEIYQSKKYKLLKKLKNLQESKLSLTNPIIKDEDLLRHKKSLEEKRDLELVHLRIFENYEMLKSSMTFYEETNKAYKNLQQVGTNKLKKLKNFFEYQRNLFTDHLNSNSSDIFDIKNKDSNKLFLGISERDYSSEIKEIIKRSINNELSEDSLKSLTSQLTDDEVLPTSVHDFMPLISQVEFDIITGDLPGKAKIINKNKKSMSKTPINVKHQIFQNPLYDPITSGSDTNASENMTPSPTKRRGRRTAGGSNLGDKLIEEESSKSSEAKLLAKIMKQFNGPQPIKPDELTNDFELLGLESLWPVSSTK